MDHLWRSAGKPLPHVHIYVLNRTRLFTSYAEPRDGFTNLGVSGGRLVRVAGRRGRREVDGSVDLELVWVRVAVAADVTDVGLLPRVCPAVEDGVPLPTRLVPTLGAKVQFLPRPGLPAPDHRVYRHQHL